VVEVVAVLAEVVVVLGVAALVVAALALPPVSGSGTRYPPVGSICTDPGTRYVPSSRAAAWAAGSKVGALLTEAALLCELLPVVPLLPF
jgi:hypothetical protein